jgi:hypothetical protein
MQIPSEIEKMILQGRAEFSAVTHNADQFIVSPPDEGYQIIFGFQIHGPQKFVSEVDTLLNYSILVASENSVNFYQYKTKQTAGTDQPEDMILYTVTENPVYFGVLFTQDRFGEPTNLDLNFSNNALFSLPVGYLPTSFLGWGAPSFYLLASTAPASAPDNLYYLPFGQPFTNNNFPGALPNPDALGFDSWYLTPKDIASINTNVVTNSQDLVQRGWATMLGITVYSVKVREPLPTRTKNKFVI